MQTSDSEDEVRPRYSNKKIRKEIEVDITDLVVAGVINKDNPATQSALEESISADLETSNKKLKDATATQRQLGQSDQHKITKILKINFSCHGRNG